MNIDSIARFYSQLDPSDLSVLRDVYHQDVVFRDPMHEIKGLENLHRYFENMYQNTRDCQFKIQHCQQSGNIGFITWQMLLTHPRLKRGQTVTVDGCSQLEFCQGRVIYHRDYFDAGQMLYENLPLLGTVVQVLKQRIGK
jgi:ketosteroid isomerase-like protein